MLTLFPAFVMPLAGCTGAPPWGDAGPAPDAAGPFVLDASWSALQKHVFSPSCTFSTCHGGPRVRSRLDLRPDASWAALVNAPARSPFRCRDGGVPDGMDGGVKRVVPGDLDASLLWEKVNATQHDLDRSCHGDLMPDTDQRLPDWALHGIRGWIERGAPRD
ncbi:MAG: hypothetical protein HY904_21040 [Deltaproteobacteria bacterium]|nr:hypothetical protein [Deltaproteobacteria bacterium]